MQDDEMRGHAPAGLPDEPGPQATTSQGRYVPPPFVWQQLTPEQKSTLESRQRGRARIVALLLGALVILVFAITIAKIKGGMAH